MWRLAAHYKRGLENMPAAVTMCSTRTGEARKARGSGEGAGFFWLPDHVIEELAVRTGHHGSAAILSDGIIGVGTDDLPRTKKVWSI